MPKNSTTFILALFILIPLLGACSPGARAVPPLDPTQMFESALLTATYGVPTATLTPGPTDTPAPTLTPSATFTATIDPNRTPPALPAPFTSADLNPLDTPHTYVQDTCEYIKNRWDPNKAAPGTIVLPIMFHAIVGGGVTDGNAISHEDFEMLMKDLHDQGFQTITTNQLADFMENNAMIPARSMILIVDDRHHAENFEVNFRPYYTDYGWTVTNAYISIPEPDALWSEFTQLISEGWIDFQAHGVVHNINMTNEVSDDFIHTELYGSIERIESHTGKRPTAIIWPGGSFIQRSVDMARQAGYRLGFTVNPRGPLMYNWVPLADAADPGRPSFLPEGPMNDPLLVLPRFWDTDIRFHIDTLRQMGNSAADYAQQNQAVELEYYNIMCRNLSGEIPALQSTPVP